MIEENDWRITDQTKYLARPIEKSSVSQAQPHMDHDHCNFCWATFSEYDDDLHEGYCTPDETYWICPECFNDFKEMFHWTLEDSSKPEPE